MDLKLLSGVICAVGMFLFGIDIMGDGLRKVCGEKMKNVLSVCTKSRLRSVLTGLLVTGTIQSSSATTIMTVSFINSGIMTLSEAVGIIMGANIGTTVTSLLIAFNFSAVAPIFVILGTALKLFSKKEKTQNIGLTVAGFGLLFVAMSSITEYLSFFKDSGMADGFILSSTTRLKSLIIGIVMTAVMQSSSATVGVLQGACLSGMVSTKNAIYILLGQNIGAVAPTLLSSVKTNIQAKSAAMVHFWFNSIGSIVFVFIIELTPYVHFLNTIENGSFRVSFAHIFFNTASTIMLYPFADNLSNIATKSTKLLLREKS